MIILCDPQCKGIMHEKINSGFIKGFRLAYPNSKIIFFAHATHITAVKDIFRSNEIEIENIEYQPIDFETQMTKIYCFSGIIRYFYLLKKIFNRILAEKSSKIFFLSNNPIILCALKILKQRARYKNICCSVVLHGEFENIGKTDTLINQSDDENPKKIIKKWLDRLANFLKRLSKKIFQPLTSGRIIYSLAFKKIFSVKRMMLWRHSGHYKYIALSSHILDNAQNYLDVKRLNFQVVTMPIIFSKIDTSSHNDFIKFAIFGSGDEKQLLRLLTALSQRKITKPYEIRIISLNDQGTEGFKNVTRVRQGEILTRKEMEDQLPDIDIFINLYDSTRYKLSCSASIFEAFAYFKPVLHLNNDCYNYYNQPERPIGYRCDSFNEYVKKMQELIENYSLYQDQFKIFRKNILVCRQEYAIENNLESLKKSFDFS